jgi:subfamily B ATP-binding cassette protein MsbA
MPTRPTDPFWYFARRMLRYRTMVVLAVLMATVSAGSLGAGLMGITPILRTILAGPSDGKSLREMARVWNQRVAPGSQLPEGVVDTIPDESPAERGLRQQAIDWNQAKPRARPIPEATIARLPDEPIGRAANLREMAAELNAKSCVNGAIPQKWIEALPTGPFTTIVVLIGTLGVLTLIGGAANFLHAFLSLTVVQRSVANIRREAFHRVLRLPLKDIVAGGTADKVSRIVGDTAALESGFNSLLSKALAQVTKGMAAFAAAIAIEWRLTLAAIPVAIIFYRIIRKLGKRIRRASRSAMQSQAGLYGAAVEALQGLRVVKVHTTERYEAGRFHRINKEVMGQMLRVRTARAIASPLVEVLSVLVVGALFLIAVNFVIKGKLEPSRVLTALGALGMAGASLKPLTGLINDIQGSKAAAGRIKELMDAAPEPGHDSSLPRLKRHQDALEFRGVTFTYPGGARPALDGISLTVHHGQRVAIVGPNGSGKTTLLALVPRLFEPDGSSSNGSLNGEAHANGELPARGSVLIDGQDIRDFSIRSLRRQIGVVTQETVLFRGTIRSNISYGADDVSPDAIEAAARLARAHDFIETLPAGYETVVGEQGLTLSGGQRQRIAIARAILRQPSILILDEATSMIDADSEAKIGDALAEFAQGRTSLIVAHRLSTVINADRIIVMDQGKIVDQGSHAELFERCAIYRLIAQNQLVK